MDDLFDDVLSDAPVTSHVVNVNLHQSIKEFYTVCVLFLFLIKGINYFVL